MMSCAETLRDLGYRLTSQRLAILDALHGTDGHVTAEDIYEQAHDKQPSTNRSTVYRTLALLKDLGLVAETDLGQGSLCYHHIEKGHHHHLVCRRCGRVTDVDETLLSGLQELIIRRFSFVPDIKHLAIEGHCVDCQG
jgi:Fur family ferric uptake transcriptional regulator